MLIYSHSKDDAIKCRHAIRFRSAPALLVVLLARIISNCTVSVEHDRKMLQKSRVHRGTSHKKCWQNLDVSWSLLKKKCRRIKRQITKSGTEDLSIYFDVNSGAAWHFGTQLSRSAMSTCFLPLPSPTQTPTRRHPLCTPYGHLYEELTVRRGLEDVRHTKKLRTLLAEKSMTLNTNCVDRLRQPST